MKGLDLDENGSLHLNNELLKQYRTKGAGDTRMEWGFDEDVRTRFENVGLEHMFIDYYADNKHRHWEEPDNPKWNKFSKKYYGLPQYEEDYTGHPDNIHLHDYFNGNGGYMSLDYFNLKYRNKLKKGLVLAPDDEAGKAEYLSTLKKMRDHPEEYEWGDLSAYPEDLTMYRDTESFKDGEDRFAADGYKNDRERKKESKESEKAKPTEEDSSPEEDDGPKLSIMGE